MKTLIISIITILSTFSLWAQSPDEFKYQSIVRNATGSIIANQNVSFRISILETTSTGNLIYSETHSVTTNDFGLVNLSIGTGAIISGDFSTIDWGNNLHFIQIELDDQGGSNYLLMGTSQLLSVPYALNAKTAESIVGGIQETDPIFTNSVANGITAVDTIFWNNHMIDTDTNIDSLGIVNFGFVAGAHTTDTQLNEVQVDAFVSNNGFLTSEVDGDITNELQTLSISNDTLFLSNGGSVATNSLNTNKYLSIPINGRITSASFTPNINLTLNNNESFYTNNNWTPSNVTSDQILLSAFIVPSDGIVKSLNGITKLNTTSTGIPKEVQFTIYKLTPNSTVAIQIGTTTVVMFGNSNTVIYNIQNNFNSSNSIQANEMIFFTVKRVDCTAPNCPTLDVQINGNIILELE